jgi:hypothetical protein
MIKTEKYYRIQTEFGERTIKALELIIEGMYGIYSPSDYLVQEDNQGTLIPNDALEATEAQGIAWENWYNNV